MYVDCSFVLMWHCFAVYKKLILLSLCGQVVLIPMVPWEGVCIVCVCSIICLSYLLLGKLSREYSDNNESQIFGNLESST